MNTWFENTFLKSFGTNKSFWLTKAQTVICTNYMTKHSSKTEDGYSHDYYTYEANSISYALQYSKLNGCGRLVIGMSKEEQEKERIRNEKEKYNRLIKTIYRTKNKHTDRFNYNLENIKYKLDYFKDLYSEDNDSITAERISENENMLNIYLNIDKLYAELEEC